MTRSTVKGAILTQALTVAVILMMPMDAAIGQTFYDITGAGRGTPQLQMTMAQCDLLAQQQVAPLVGQNYGRGLGGAIGAYAVISQAKANAYQQCILANGWSRQPPPPAPVENQQTQPTTLAQIQESLNRELPRRLDNYTIFRSIVIKNQNEFEYNYEISDISGNLMNATTEQLAALIGSMKESPIKKWCDSSTMMWKQRRYFVHYIYRFPDSAIVYQFTLDSAECVH